MLRTNILANLAGTGWIALLTLVATPIQIRLLGMEAYGLVGLITVLQIMFATLDLGLSASVTQTIASDRSPGRSQSAPLTNSVGSIYAIVAAVIGILLWLTAGWISTRWLNPQGLDQETVLAAVRAIGLYVAFRWPIAFCTGVLNGVQRMDVLNLLKAGAATVRIGVGVVLIAIWPSITLFLAWFAVSAMLELFAFAIATRRLVPELRPTIRISWPALQSVWRFSAAMAVVAILAMAITQMDRIFVSKLLPLEDFGYYSLAYTAAIAISLLQTSINNAALPYFAEAASHGRAQLAARYAKVSELTSFVVALPCFLLIFFASDIFRLWVSEESGREAASPLKLLAIGCFINAAVSSAYLSSVATRNPAIAAIVNIVGAALYAPVLFFLAKTYGTVGAAAGWAILNLYYLVTLLPAVHRRVLREPILPLLWHGFAAPALAAVVAAGSMKLLASTADLPLVAATAFLLAIPLYALLAHLLISPALRQSLQRAGLGGRVLSGGATVR